MRGHRGFTSRLLAAALVAAGLGVAAPGTNHAHAATLTGTTTTVTITSSANPSGYGEVLILSATVIQAQGTVVPDGSVTFTDGSTSLGTVTLDSLGQAALSESALTTGTHSIVAAYSGSSSFDPSISGTMSQVITAQGSTTMIVSSLNPAVFGTAVVFIVNVFANGGTATPTGSITILDGATALTSKSLGPSGTAVAGISSLSVGDHSISASYAGDGNFTPSSGGGLTETVSRAATSLALTSSANPSISGQPVTFTATVTPASGNNPTGSVSFADGATALGSSGLDSHGAATLTTASLGAGSHSITASYAGDGSFSGSISPPLSQAVGLPPTSTSLGTSANPAEYSTPVTLTAAVTAVAGLPTGSVTFTDGAATLGSAPIDAAGRAGRTVTTLSVGTHLLGAAYSGDASFAPSVASGLNEVITAAHSGLTIASSANPVVLGASLTLTATLTTDNLGATGVVRFLDGSAALGSSSLDAPGHAALTLSSLGTGRHSLTAAYGGDPGTAPAVSAPLTEIVLVAPSGTALTSSSNPALAGQAVTFTATVTAGAATPTGSVAFSDGGAVLGTAGVDAAGHAAVTTSALPVGSHTITATYSGDANLAGSSAAVNQVINLTPTDTGLTSSSNPATVTTPLTLTATVTAATGNVPSGIVAFSDGGTSLGSVQLGADGRASLTTSALDIGIHHITATYAGDGAHFASSISPRLEQTITPISTHTTLTASADPITVGTTVTFVATVTSATGATPTGEVALLDGTTVVTGAAVAADGTATLTTSALGTGDHTITATFTGSAPFGNSVSAALTETVLKAPATVSLTSSANPSVFGNPITLTAVVGAAAGGSPTGTVTFLDGSTALGTAILSGGTASLTVTGLGGGSHALTAAYFGDSDHGSATSSVLDQSVAVAATTTVLTVGPNPARAGAPVLLSVTVTSSAGQPGGSVTFLDGTTSLGSVAVTAGAAAMTTSDLTRGAHQVTAVYSGTADYAASRSTTVTLHIRARGEGCDGDTAWGGGDDDRDLERSSNGWQRHRHRRASDECQPPPSADAAGHADDDRSGPRDRGGAGHRDE